MRFEWDERKRRENLRKHGLDFRDTAELFQGPVLVTEDDREDYGETRWIGIGFLAARVVVVAFSEPDAQTVRVISLRKALSHERARFEEELRNRLGES